MLTRREVEVCDCRQKQAFRRRQSYGARPLARRIWSVAVDWKCVIPAKTSFPEVEKLWNTSAGITAADTGCEPILKGKVRTPIQLKGFIFGEQRKESMGRCRSLSNHQTIAGESLDKGCHSKSVMMQLPCVFLESETNLEVTQRAS